MKYLAMILRCYFSSIKIHQEELHQLLQMFRWVKVPVLEPEGGKERVAKTRNKLHLGEGFKGF